MQGGSCCLSFKHKPQRNQLQRPLTGVAASPQIESRILPEKALALLVMAEQAPGEGSGCGQQL